MHCLFRLIGLLSVLIGGSLMVAPAPQPPRPVIVTLTCDIGFVGYRPFTQFAWQTQHATTVRAESGHVDAQNQFYPGGWYVADDLPPQGSSDFSMKIDNYAVRVCITAPEVPAGPVCAVCNPEE